MRSPDIQNLLYPSVRDYLVRLGESGIDGIPSSGHSGDLLKGMTPVPGAPPPSEDFVKAGEPLKETLGEVRKALGDCHRCKLGSGRTNLVFGVGASQAGILFVGEGPGADEDRQGEPFVGEAGQVLNRLITAMGLTREQVYICNVVKCRPPGNRNPEADEVKECLPFLMRQIRSVSPKVIIALGNVAAHALLGNREPISRIRGKFHEFKGIPLMPTYHPSYLLRNKGDARFYWEVWGDMAQVLQLLGLPVPEKSRKG